MSLKKAAYGPWWAVDRASKRVLGWTLGDRGTATAERLDAQLPHAAHRTFATDFWHPYVKIFGQDRHLQGKAHTFTIKSPNNGIRCSLARLKRRTHSYSKSRENLAASILYFIVQKCGRELGPELNPNAEIKSQEQTEETEQEALARTHAGTFCSTKDTHGMSSDSVLSVPSCKSYFGVRV